MKNTLFLILFFVLLIVPDIIAQDKIVINPDNKSSKIAYWGYDIKQPGKAAGLNPQFAERLYGELGYGFNLLRIPIYPRDAHPQNGFINKELYKTINNAVKNVLAINPKVKIFTSIRLEGTETFPSWCADINIDEKGNNIGTGVYPEEYASLIGDYLAYMKEENIPIHYLGIDNESEYNKGKITVDKYNIIVNILKARSKAGDFELPQLIAPDGFSPQVDWYDNFIASGSNNQSNVDVMGTHYYPKFRPLSKIKNISSKLYGRDFWNTEVHWDKEDGTFLDEATGALIAFFDCVDVNMNGFVWWAFTSNESMKGIAEQEMTQTTIGSYKIDVSDFDGTDMTRTKFNTRAFLKDNQIYLWVLNNRENSLENVSISLNSNIHNIISDIEYISWQTNIHKGIIEYKNENNNEFIYSLPAKSIFLFKIPVSNPETTHIIDKIDISISELDFGYYNLKDLKEITKNIEFSVFNASSDVNITLDGDSEFVLKSPSVIEKEEIIWKKTISLGVEAISAGEYNGTIKISSGENSHEIPVKAQVIDINSYDIPFIETFPRLDVEMNTNELLNYATDNVGWNIDNCLATSEDRIKVSQEGYIQTPKIRFEGAYEVKFFARMFLNDIGETNAEKQENNNYRNIYALINNDTVFNHKMNGGNLYQNFNEWSFTHIFDGEEKLVFYSNTLNQGVWTDKEDGFYFGGRNGNKGTGFQVIPTTKPAVNIAYGENIKLEDINKNEINTRYFNLKGVNLTSDIKLNVETPDLIYIEKTEFNPENGNIDTNIKITFLEHNNIDEYTAKISLHSENNEIRKRNINLNYNVINTSKIDNPDRDDIFNIYTNENLFFLNSKIKSDLYIYNIQGVLIKKAYNVSSYNCILEKGLYIIRFSGKTKKILVNNL